MSTLPWCTLAKMAFWASKHLSAREEGMLYALHPHLTPPRYSVAFTDVSPFTATEGPSPRFAATLEAFAHLECHLDEFARSLPEAEQRAFTLSLLGDEDSRSLLRHLLIVSAPDDHGPISERAGTEPAS